MSGIMDTANAFARAKEDIREHESALGSAQCAETEAEERLRELTKDSTLPLVVATYHGAVVITEQGIILAPLADARPGPPPAEYRWKLTDAGRAVLAEVRIGDRVTRQDVDRAMEEDKR